VGSPLELAHQVVVGDHGYVCNVCRRRKVSARVCYCA
jgi:hypothetical protein